MSQNLHNHYDTLVIGAGLSGLAAAIRVAIAGKKVLLIERHNAPGGLNSFYSIAGRKYDVGLHALTNFAPKGAAGAPLTKILRQLRLRYEDLHLCEQTTSSIIFGNRQLKFSNNIGLLQSEIQREFPASMDAFVRMMQQLPIFEAIGSKERRMSARAVLASYFTRDPLLVEMLLAPIMYYGSASEHDLDWASFVILFRSLFLEGLARPVGGIRTLLRLLVRQYRQLGGEKLMHRGVQRLHLKDGCVSTVVLDNGQAITAGCVLSCAGYDETLALCGHDLSTVREHKRLSFVETVYVLDKMPKQLGWEDTICFYNQTERFEYACPADAVDVRSGVICLPNNYQHDADDALSEGWLKITALANYTYWDQWDELTYQEQKAYWAHQLLAQALKFLPAAVTPQKIKASTLAHDMFTPRTVKKFTGHVQGSIYGTPIKSYEGLTPYKNLFVCGADQGLLGITGAMLSGILMANRYVLSKDKS